MRKNNWKNMCKKSYYLLKIIRIVNNFYLEYLNHCPGLSLRFVVNSYKLNQNIIYDLDFLFTICKRRFFSYLNF